MEGPDVKTSVVWTVEDRCLSRIIAYNSVHRYLTVSCGVSHMAVARLVRVCSWGDRKMAALKVF